MIGKFLDKVYAARDLKGTKALYDEWSASYDAEVGEFGYVTPARCAAALAAYAPDKSVPVLDFGCGTGLAGEALRDAGFEAIDGVDLSAKMLAQAKAKDIYRKLTQITADTPLGKDYRLISAVGVIGSGAAPISALDMLLRALPVGGKLVFSFNDHALADPVNTGRLNEWLDCGAARLLFKEHGAHLPGKNMKSTVYVIEIA
ncbi:MAG: class I SAM-dependent methyltransferase [Sulfitobacter sp.]|nr:class I SAM-dependent methyltransferase [Sulfitobacter sp.]MDG1352426.1 class I SAM-dependent methyltransferase [Sulfitobacter sp.]